MKKLLDGTIFEAVNGLWLSGLYGMGAGAGAGLIVGGIVGTIIPIAGNVVGAVIGTAVGAVVGLPAGILGHGLTQRSGWRTAGALSCFAVGIAIARVWYGQDSGVRHSLEAQRDFLLYMSIALTVFTLVGLWVGNVVFNRLQTKQSDFYDGWRKLIGARNVNALPTKERIICLAIALLPILMTYGQIVAWLVKNFH